MQRLRVVLVLHQKSNLRNPTFGQVKRFSIVCVTKPSILFLSDTFTEYYFLFFHIDYNPLMGGAGGESRYRPDRRSGGAGGGG